MPARIKKYEPLGMLYQKTKHGQPYPLRLWGGHTRSPQQAAIVTAKRQIGRHPDFARSQYMYLHLIKKNAAVYILFHLHFLYQPFAQFVGILQVCSKVLVTVLPLVLFAEEVEVVA